MTTNQDREDPRIQQLIKVAKDLEISDSEINRILAGADQVDLAAIYRNAEIAPPNKFVLALSLAIKKRRLKIKRSNPATISTTNQDSSKPDNRLPATSKQRGEGEWWDARFWAKPSGDEIEQNIRTPRLGFSKKLLQLSDREAAIRLNTTVEFFQNWKNQLLRENNSDKATLNKNKTPHKDTIKKLNPVQTSKTLPDKKSKGRPRTTPGPLSCNPDFEIQRDIQGDNWY